ncbi:MAG: hypothetical protein HPY83_19525 [Anaerolineae bacterium]|nr:hypothetical protein [Anaerolineae bacterium]
MGRIIQVASVIACIVMASQALAFASADDDWAQRVAELLDAWLSDIPESYTPSIDLVRVGMHSRMSALGFRYRLHEALRPGGDQPTEERAFRLALLEPYARMLLLRLYGLVDSTRTWSANHNDDVVPRGFEDLVTAANEMAALHNAVRAYRRADSIRAHASTETEDELSALWEAIGDLYTRVR